MERDHALGSRLASRYTQSCCTVRVAVEAVQTQATDLLASGSTPACHEECGALIRTRQGPDGNHQPLKLVRRDIARHAMGSSRKIARRQQRAARHIIPTPGGGIA